MDFISEDLGKVAKLRIDAKSVEFKGIEPKKVGAVDIAVLGNAKIVACIGATKEQLLQQLTEEGFCQAVQNAWVLAVHGSEFCEEFAKKVHPYVTVLAKSQELRVESYEACSRGWNVENEAGEHVSKKCLVVGKDANAVEVLFGESRENPIGILSVKRLNA